MIKQKEVTINNHKFLYTFSDKNLYILQIETNNKYDSAYDIIPCKYTYKETDELIKDE